MPLWGFLLNNPLTINRAKTTQQIKIILRVNFLGFLILAGDGVIFSSLALSFSIYF
jgi:hypothetical protein